MSIIKVSEATRLQLDWMVAKAEGYEEGVYMRSPVIRIDAKGKAYGLTVPINREYVWFAPTTNWAQGGPIIEREMIGTQPVGSRPLWCAGTSAYDCEQQFFTGPTPLVAAMRCFVSLHLGKEVDVPEELV